MSLPHALLGLLAVAPRTGYDLTKVFAGEFGRYAWQAGHTSIYPELARLADQGLVEVTHEGARGSRTYAVTDAGRAALRTWLLTPREHGKVRDERVLRMFLLSALDPADARTDRIPGDVYIGGQLNRGWGLHVADMSIAQGDVLRLVEAQERAFSAVRAPRSAARPRPARNR